jgi:hypothetical protein
MRLRVGLFVWIVQVLYMQSACYPVASQNSVIEADAVARRFIGSPVPYDNQMLTADQKISAMASLEATRALAWKVFAQVITPVNLEATKPDGTKIPMTLPKVFTWYSPEDIQRLMQISYKAADADQLREGVPLTQELLQRSQDLLATELDLMPMPLQKRWQKYLKEHPSPTASDLIGLAGFNRTLFSPDLVGAVVRRYADLQDCYPQGQKPLPNIAFRPCWQEALPASSVMVKTAWVNTRSDFHSFATDAKSLAALFADKDSSWSEHAQTIPLPETILHARNSDQDFVLAGMHIVTKDLDDWLWITAFWSADPDSDFGSDRPEAVKSLGAPWNQYKICAVSSYTQDPQTIEGLAAKFPDLADAYRAALDQRGGASWCSNPYIEQGAHNNRTNCIGCHQFAGTQIQQDKILADSLQFPLQGSLKQRQDFPSDYIWSATQGSMGWMSLMNPYLFNRQTQP